MPVVQTQVRRRLVYGIWRQCLVAILWCIGGMDPRRIVCRLLFAGVNERVSVGGQQENHDAQPDEFQIFDCKLHRLSLVNALWATAFWN